MLNQKQFKSYYIGICYKNNTKEYISSEIRISTDNYFLGYIKLYKNNRLVVQMNFTNEETLFKNIYI